MSTRCQIGFYESANKPSTHRPPSSIATAMATLQGPSGVLATLLPWAVAFDKARGLDDAEYAAARGLVALIQGADALNDTIGYGICGDGQLYGDIAYYYRVDPSGITVYLPAGDDYAALTLHSRHALGHVQAPDCA